jgi:nucleotide-binding universal stress UspA family protein
MFQTILVPTDGSALSDAAASAAVRFAKQIGGKIVALSVAEPAPHTIVSDGGAFIVDIADYEQKARELAQKHVDRVAAVASAEQVPCDTVIALSFSPYQEIVQAATDYHCDLIFMATHGRKGLNKLFLGSETQKVLAHTTVPVLVHR